MHIKLGYGKGFAELNIEDENLLGVIKPNAADTTISVDEEIKSALENPIGTRRLKDIVSPGERIAIITSDITRPMPSKVVMPFILEELYRAGIQAEDIKIVFALGSHRKHTEEEKKVLVGEKVYSQIECIDSDVNDCINMGRTSSGTPGHFQGCGRGRQKNLPRQY